MMKEGYSFLVINHCNQDHVLKSLIRSDSTTIREKTDVNRSTMEAALEMKTTSKPNMNVKELALRLRRNSFKCTKNPGFSIKTSTVSM